MKSFWKGWRGQFWKHVRQNERPAVSVARGKTPAAFIDPKWTEGHFLAPMILPHIEEAERVLGSEVVEAILHDIGIDKKYFLEQTNWVSTAFVDVLFEKLSQRCDTMGLAKRAGWRILRPEFVGIKFFLLKFLIPTSAIFRTFPKSSSRFVTTFRYEVNEVTRGRAVVSLAPKSRELTPKRREICASWQTSLANFIRMKTGKRGHVKKLSCHHDGAPECRYEMTWKTGTSPVYFVFLFLLSAILPVSWILEMGESISDSVGAIAPFLGGVVGLLTAALAFLVRQIYLLRRETKILDDEMTKFEAEGNLRYAELQAAKLKLDQRYREARLLDRTAKTIQRSDDLPETLQTAMSAICENFGFDGAFLLLHDEERTVLRTAAVSGITDGRDLVWEQRVPVGEGDKSTLEAAYRGGKPLILTETDFLLHLDSSLSFFFRSRRVQEVMVVPVPSDSGCWGLLFAEKHKNETGNRRSQLVLLQRVAQYLGIAIDKQTRLELETKLRRIFQKYVPAPVLQGQPVLGGQLREISCMFLDIRDFTHMTQQLPPDRIIELLNRVFGMVQEVVAKSGGIIDKYLGDGVLVTWGAQAEVKDSTLSAVRAAFEILEKLATVNEGLTRDGFPTIEVGIGIHKGPAIVGNIGSEDRLEFTSVGSTVNLASRLEGLCKRFESSLIVSQAVLRELPSEASALWNVVDSVPIRGLDWPIPVAVLRPTRVVMKAASPESNVVELRQRA